jgi:hypothetical protein
MVTKTFDRKDVNTLRDMFSALGALRPIFNLLLGIIEKVMDLLRL